MQNNKVTYILSVIAMLFAAFASAAGLFLKTLYNDNEFVKTAWYGNDWVTLTVVIPSLLILFFFLDRNSVKIQLVWLGLLGYLLYNYAFYLFGAAFNAIFILYVSIFSLSLFALISGLSNLSAFQISASSKTVRWISVYLLLVTLMLCLVEIPPILQFISTGKLPDIIGKTNHPTGIIYALDLSLIVPVMIIAAVLLWQNRTWGYVLSALMLLKGFTYGMVLTVGTILLAQKNIKDPLLPVWIFITIGGIAGLILLLTKILISRKS